MAPLLFYEQPMEQQCSAKIVSLLDRDGRSAVVLDRTLFYPAGGGQPGDSGTIAVKDTVVRIAGTEKTDHDEVLHLLAATADVGAAALDKILVPGQNVTLTLDWDHRFDFMQQHTGQHLLSAALFHVANANTVAVHQGNEVTTIEVDVPVLTDAALEAVEDAARRIIREDRPVRSFLVDSDDLPRYSLRRPTTRTGAIRLVEIPKWDLVACAGVHLPSTARVGNVQIVSVEKIRGHARIAFKIGERAHLDYREKHRASRAAAELFSSSVADLPARVEQSLQEVRDLHRRLRLHTERAAQEAIASLNAEAGTAGDPLVLRLENAGDSLFSAVVKEATATVSGHFCVVSIRPGQSRWAIVAPGAASADGMSLRSEVLDPGGAKGGGRPPTWQGVCPDPDRLLELFTSWAR